jgi:hemin uptake protein HemP
MSASPTPPFSAEHKPSRSVETTVQPTVIDSATLFAGKTEIRVRHRDQEYRLRITRQGKLILTK